MCDSRWCSYLYDCTSTRVRLYSYGYTVRTAVMESTSCSYSGRKISKNCTMSFSGYENNRNYKFGSWAFQRGITRLQRPTCLETPTGSRIALKTRFWPNFLGSPKGDQAMRVRGRFWGLYVGTRTRQSLRSIDICDCLFLFI